MILTIVAIIYVAAFAADMITTKRALKRGAKETNKVVLWTMKRFGPRGWIYANLVLTGACWALPLAAHYAGWIPLDGALIIVGVIGAIRAFVAFRNTRQNRTN